MEIPSSSSKYKGWGRGGGGLGRRCISSHKQSENLYRRITFFFSLNRCMGEGEDVMKGGGLVDMPAL